MDTAQRVRWSGMTLLAALSGAACANDAVSGAQIEVHTDADAFQYQVIAISSTTVARTYSWQNSGSQASIDLTTASGGGMIHLQIRDAANTIIYDADLPANVQTTTAPGTAGGWRVSVNLTGFAGTAILLLTKL